MKKIKASYVCLLEDTHGRYTVKTIELLEDNTIYFISGGKHYNWSISHFSSVFNCELPNEFYPVMETVVRDNNVFELLDMTF